ncbi:hypothetical protein N7481_012071 [Penicillium waksmanii]|uniref:uncharacterized protein n=1 Tax=Penicillium waksmanii TaxID=69791 RepID=UPI002548B370|nr:uncharacterized protein N7481_012071 [Penicillium waksmanii]KAJ5965357.1 hypothetical protein N7481_012071 [Penicillium waksmanii]
MDQRLPKRIPLSDLTLLDEGWTISVRRRLHLWPPQQWAHGSPSGNLYPIDTNVQHLGLDSGNASFTGHAAAKWPGATMDPAREWSQQRQSLFTTGRV